MTPPRDPDTHRLARRILTWQALTSVGLASIGAAAFGTRAGLWVLAGGAIGTVANLYMTLAALRSVGGNAGLALRRLFTGQFVKVGLTVLLFVVVARRGDAIWPAVIVGYVATLVVFWALPALAAPKLPPRSRPRPGDDGRGA
ncbi:MAG: ATP synthase subunit I [Steroidobacteraceae bacterium]|nr:ATP synthase subunit I [Steroidobacteraceae bacterium]